MIDKVQKALQEASLYLKEQAGNLSGSAREKAYQLIDDWLAVFPKLENFYLDARYHIYNHLCLHSITQLR